MSCKVNFIAGAILAGIVLSTSSASYCSSPDDKAGQIDTLMTAFHQQRQFHGVVLVAENGKVLYNKAFGMADRENHVPNTFRTPFRIASMSKQFAAAAAMMLVSDGRLRLDDHVCDYLPDYPKETGQSVTVDHLLTHTSGIIQDNPLKGAFAENKYRPNTHREMRSYFQDSSLLFIPGQGFQYSNFNYNLLAMIIEAVSGKPYAEFLQERIFAPLGMSQSGTGDGAAASPPVATGYECAFLKAPAPAQPPHPSTCQGSGDVYATVGDLLKWDRALYTETLLPAEYRDMMFTAYANDGRYGYGWQMGGYPIGNGSDSVYAVYHDGGGPGMQSIIIRLPDDKRLIVILSNHNEPWLHIRLSRPREDIAPQILAILYGREYELPKTSAAYTLAVADTLSADYDLPSEFAKLHTERPEEFSFDGDEFYCAGLCYMWDKKPQKALPFLQVAVEELGTDHLPHGWQCRNVYGEALFAHGLIEKGCIQFEKSLELKPDNPTAVRTLKAAEPYR
ncbi:MAG: beta-lactamase family protein [candidate division Zixibacteria bacterium]|nr:beta-lactamase family protein [candidate division Zixibacteria bacterium]